MRTARQGGGRRAFRNQAISLVADADEHQWAAVMHRLQPLITGLAAGVSCFSPRGGTEPVLRAAIEQRRPVVRVSDQ